LFATCVFGSALALDCSAKTQAFHTCLEAGQKKNQDAEKAKFEALKVKIDACYTDNGCTPPAKPQKGKGGEEKRNSTAGNECRKALGQAEKQQFEACVQKAVPGFTFPPKDATNEKREGGDHKRFNPKDDKKSLDSCAKKQQVRDCKRALFNSTRPSQDEIKAQFQARCDVKQNCLVALGADCQAQLESFKKAACQCRQQQRAQADQVRSGIAACSGVQEKKPKAGKENVKERSCDEKDYCKLGFDAFVQDRKTKGGKNQ